jgi:serine/threonine-protein kinase
MFQEHELINEQYEVLRTLAGGMGYVYIVIDQVTGNHYAIKTIKDAILQNPEAFQRFEREARTWINLGTHPNIVHAVTFHRGSLPLLILEYIDGPNLRRLLSSEPGGLDFSEVCHLALQIAEGLSFAHSPDVSGRKTAIIHRDLKPDNVMITTAHVAKLTDFGLAKTMEDSVLTAPYSAMGSLPYMPPEQFVDARSANTRSDIYSFGVMLYEMLAGTRPFTGGSSPELMHKIFHCLPTPIRELRGDTPSTLKSIVEACMEKRTEDRPDSLIPVISDLKSFAAQSADQRTPCSCCGYVARKQHVLCPLCGAEEAQTKRDGAGSAEMLRCVCGEQMPTDFRFCVGCGKSLIASAPKAAECPSCGVINPPDFRFCQICGHKMPTISRPDAGA